MQFISDISKHLTMKCMYQTAVGERLLVFCLDFTLTKVTYEGYQVPIFINYRSYAVYKSSQVCVNEIA